MIYILTSSSQILQPKVIAEEPRSNELIHAQLSWDAEDLLGTEESYHEQQGYLRNAAHAAYVSLNALDQENHFRLKADLDVVQGQEHAVNLIEGSSSSGLGYSLAVFSTWWHTVLQKSDWPAIPIFATGEVSPSGQIKPISHLPEKLQAVCDYAQSNKLSQFYICYPKNNQSDIPENVSQEIARQGGTLLGAERLPELLEQILGEHYDGDPLGKWQPFKGLKAFEFNDAMHFFGRDKEVLSLEEDLQSNQGILFVIGSSGTGKSSLIKAGLIPKLKSQNPELKWTQVKPSEVPQSQGLVDYLIEQLNQAWQLEQQCFDTQPLIKEIGHPKQLEKAIDQLKTLVEPQQQNVLIYLDQFEEVFSDVYQSPHPLADELSWLDTIARQLPQLQIILSLRNEYLSLLLEKNALNSPVISTIKSELKTEQWQEIVQKQTKFAGLKFQDGLDKLIINDAVNTPYALPMVEYVLEQLYLKAIEKDPLSTQLKIEHYRELGGISGVIAKQANLAMEIGTDNLTEKQAKNLIKAFFTAFIGIDENDLLIAQNPTRETLEDYYPIGLMDIVNTFIDKGLIVSRGKKHSSSLRLAHDTLLNVDTDKPHWPALVEWHKDNQVFLNWRHRIEGNFKYWVSSHQTQNNIKLEDSHFLGKSDLELAHEFSEQSKIYDELLIDYISESQKVYKQKIEYELKLLDEANHNYALALNERAILKEKDGNIDHAKYYASYALSLAISKDIPEESRKLLTSKGISLNLLFSSLLLPPYCQKEVASSVAFSQDGRFLAFGAGSYNSGVIILWDFNSYAVKVFEGHKRLVDSVDFTSNGKYIVSGSRDNTVRLWETKNGKSRIIGRHSLSVHSVQFSDDGKWVVSGASDGSIHLWNLETSQPREFKGHSDAVNSVVFSMDGKSLISGSSDHTIRIWDIKTGKMSKKFRLNNSSGDFTSGSILSLSVSSDGKYIATGTNDGIIRVWKVKSKTGNPIEFQNHSGEISSIKFLSNNTLILSASHDKTIRLTNILTGHSQCFQGHSKEITSVDISHDNLYFVSTSKDKSVCLWRINSNPYMEFFSPPNESSLHSVGISSDGQSIVSSSATEAVRLWDINTGHSILINKITGFGVTKVVFSKSGDKVFFNAKGFIFGFDVKTESLEKIVESGGNCLFSLSQDGLFIVLIHPFTGPSVWNINSRTLEWNSQQSSKFIGLKSVAFSTVDNTVAFASKYNKVIFWHPELDQIDEFQLPVFYDYGFGFNSLEFSPDGKNIILGSEGPNVLLLNLKTRQLKEYRGHSSSVLCVAFSPCGSWFASGSSDSSIILWSIKTGKSFRFDGDFKQVTSLMFSSDGKNIVSSHLDMKLRLWDLDHVFKINDSVNLSESMSKQLGLHFKGLDLVHERNEQFFLINSLFKNFNSPKDNKMFLLNKAINGHPESLLQLGIVEHRECNWHEAQKWYIKAKQAGHPEANHRLELLEKHKKPIY